MLPRNCCAGHIDSWFMLNVGIRLHPIRLEADGSIVG